MSKIMYEKELLESGFTQKQAKVYVACLEFGMAKAPDIAQKAGLKRTTVYGILDELISLGTVSLVQKGRLKYFRAQDPKDIVRILEDRKGRFERVLPKLSELYTTKQLRPRVEFYDGKEGVKHIFEDTLKTKHKEILQIVRVHDFVACVGESYAKQYIIRRAERGIVAKALHPVSGDIHNRVYGEESHEWRREVRYLPPSMFYASMIMVYDDKVAMVSTKKENFGFIIQSKEFASTQRAYYEFMWKVGTRHPEQ